MILDYVHMAHYSPVNIEENDESWQMELYPLLTGQPSKNRETK
jgi:hypothetical protein